MMSSKITDLAGLGFDDVSGMTNVFINKLLVLNVDKRAKEGYDGSEKGEAPQWEQLDEEIGDEGAEESTDCNPNVLNEYYALELNDGKVDQLRDILGETFKRFLADGKVLLWTKLSSDSIS